jgi:hypothetical protein
VCPAGRSPQGECLFGNTGKKPVFSQAYRLRSSLPAHLVPLYCVGRWIGGGRVPTFSSQLSNDQLTHLAQKSVARASRKYSAGFMLAALNETDRLSDDQLRQLVEMPDFGEAVASWYGACLFFTSGEWQRWIERHADTVCPSAIISGVGRLAISATGARSGSAAPAALPSSAGRQRR